MSDDEYDEIERFRVYVDSIEVTEALSQGVDRDRMEQLVDTHTKAKRYTRVLRQVTRIRTGGWEPYEYAVPKPFVPAPPGAVQRREMAT